jgi:nitroreductase
MQVSEALRTTRTVRKRLDLNRPVEREVVEECLGDALQAPNGSNRQVWHWILIDDPAVRRQVTQIYRDALDSYAAAGVSADKPVLADRSDAKVARMSASVMYLRDHLDEVPVLVLPVIAGRLEGASTFFQASVWGSIIPAVWSMMLSLRSRGLGSAWTTIHLHKEAEMAALLGIPAGYTQVGLFPVAYTIGTEFGEADRRPVREVSSWNSFSRTDADA